MGWRVSSATSVAAFRSCRGVRATCRLIGRGPSTPVCCRRGCRARSRGSCGMWPDDLVDLVHREVVDAAMSDPATVARIARARAPLAPSGLLDGVIDRVLARTDGLGPLEPLLADPLVSEVMVNGPGPVWIERGGELAVS